MFTFILHFIISARIYSGWDTVLTISSLIHMINKHNVYVKQCNGLQHCKTGYFSTPPTVNTCINDEMQYESKHTSEANCFNKFT